MTTVATEQGAAGGIPWFAKILVKLVLSRLPIAYALWRRIGIFRHGFMTDVAYAQQVVREHTERAGLGARLDGLVVLELGPGDSVLSGLIARARGAAQTLLVDVGDFASKDPELYRDAASRLRALGDDAPEVPAATAFQDVLTMTGTTYLTDGVDALRRLPTDSVDVAWSQAVLEHVRRRDFLACMVELHRVLKPGACASHTVDLRDHLGGSLNNLRFAERLWEADWFASAGFYTNRISRTAMLQLMETAGFEVTVTRTDHWASLPLDRRRLSRRFRALEDDELRVKGFDVLLRKPAVA